VKVSGGKVVSEYYMSNALVRVEAVSTTTNENGSPIAGYTKLYQNGKLTLEENWGPGPIRQRTFIRDGKPLLTETDKDGDGIFEWIVVNRDDGEAYAVFKCLSQHSIELLGASAVADYNEGLKEGKGIIEVITNRNTRPPGP